MLVPHLYYVGNCSQEQEKRAQNILAGREFLEHKGEGIM